MAATLRAIRDQAQQVDELIPSNPAARSGKFFDARHDAREHVVALKPEDVARVLKAATKWYSDHELAIRLLFYTGMREGEMLGPRWGGHRLAAALDRPATHHRVQAASLDRERAEKRQAPNH
jgi:integrase